MRPWNCSRTPLSRPSSLANFDINIEGLDVLASRIEAVKAALPKNVAAAVYQFGEELMSRSKEVVPVDTGALMNSGYVTLPETSGDTVSVTVGYGGPAAEYALAVHENMDPHVHWHRPGSGPKYLENPAKEMESQFPDRIAQAVRDSF